MEYYTLCKAERLTGEKEVKRLFQDGVAFTTYPYRVLFLKKEGTDVLPVRVLFSVPKKRFKHAVDRNRIKRLMRESYRLNKRELVEAMREKPYSIEVAFVSVADEVPAFEKIQVRMRESLSKIMEALA